jgi:ABC-2 type transport system ATP-binding protein
MTAMIEMRGLTKHYGDLVALDGLTLTIEQGEVFGFIGPNGAGKTTTMRILTGLLRPTAGEAWVAGCSVTADPIGVRRAIGYMPDYFGVYDDMRVWEYLDFFAACYNIPPATRGPMVDDLLALVDLGHKKHAPVESLSRGMKQRLCLARTLTHDPQVLILDEPASGLDPRARIEMRELLRELQRLGKTIFFSSHILAEVADICTSIGIIENGRLVAAGNIDEMMRRLRAHRLIALRLLPMDSEAAEALAAWLADQDGVARVEAASPPDGPWRLDFVGDDAALSAILKRLVERGAPVLSFHEEQGDLEDVFLHVTGGAAEQPAPQESASHP